MTTGERAGNRERTTAAMHSTATQLEEAEATLHRSAEAAPEEEARRRLHSLGDQVTAEAQAIERRADRLDDQES
ncbi:hypothetical protein [Actinoplanes sp. NPDC051411]|uniref:hypothetical protein n=1 Tax=Actinoplanes sp. NPDC051411 TaxID=3155522 RepID=UPI0034445568